MRLLLIVVFPALLLLCGCTAFLDDSGRFNSYSKEYARIMPGMKKNEVLSLSNFSKPDKVVTLRNSEVSKIYDVAEVWIYYSKAYRGNSYNKISIYFKNDTVVDMKNSSLPRKHSGQAIEESVIF